MINTSTDKIKSYSATICGADGEEKVEFPNICGENLSKLVDVCLSVGLPVLIDRPIYSGNEKEDYRSLMETGE